jgi:hypothetical protein
MTVIRYFHFGLDAVLLDEQTYVSLKEMVSSTWCTISGDTSEKSEDDWTLFIGWGIQKSGVT